MRPPAALLDPGVRVAVARLNEIGGVTTRASCEGHTAAAGRRHADLAYVAFEYPLPLGFQAFLIDALAMCGRVEDDAVYSRWPEDNPRFLERLQRAAQRYRLRERRQRHQGTRCQLTRLHSRLATHAAAGRQVTASICFKCRGVVLSPHVCEGEAMELLSWPADSQVAWFADFVAQPGNRLERDVVESLGSDELERRARRGDFGTTFRRRWLRYRNDIAKQQMTRSLRAGVEALRRAGSDLDVLFDARYARFTWRETPGSVSRRR